MADISINDTTIFLGGISIHEPVTALTDFIIAGLCLHFFFELRKTEQRDSVTNYWSYFFLSLFFATLAGGCSHAFFSLHEGVVYKSFWLSMHVFNGLSIYAAQLATLHSVLNLSSYKNLLQRLCGLQLILFLPAVFVFQNFLVVVIALAIGLIPIMIIHFMNMKSEPANSWIASGILISFLTAFVHLSKFSLHAYFTYHDISHVLIMLNLSIMFVGIKQKAITSPVVGV